jgi:GNAT superfamily N-acetyltransferase
MNSFQIREARIDDAPALAGLRYSFRAELKAAAEDRDTFVDRCTEWMATRLAGGSWKCWVAESSDDGGRAVPRIVATVWVELVEKLPNPNGEPECHAYLTSFVVVPAHRGGGLGSRMLRIAIEWCESRGVDSIFLWPSEKSRPLYERNGFGVAVRMMERG